LAPRSPPGRDDSSGCLIPHASLFPSTRSLTHSHDNHQRTSASSITSNAWQRQTKCLLGDTDNLARLTPDTAKSTHQPASRSLPFSQHQISSPKHVSKRSHITRTLSSLNSHFGRRAYQIGPPLTLARSQLCPCASIIHSDPCLGWRSHLDHHD
jgi:hypothetical protein